MVDRATLLGLAATAGLLLWVMVAGAGFAVDAFWRTPSLALVVGGAGLTTLVAYPAARFRSIWPVVRNAFYVRTHSPTDSIITLVALAEIARRKGLLALERPVEGLNDEFLKRVMRMAIDGMDPAVIRSVTEAELASTDQRHREGKGLIETIGRSAPTFGMMGTLIGLVIMLGQMNDPSKIGPGMAVALLTTLYGLVVANVFCWPVARKLALRSREELLCKTVVLEGVLALQGGDHPRILAEKLRAYVPANHWGDQVTRPTSDRMMAGDSRQTGAQVPLSGSDNPGQEFVEAA